MGMSPFSRSDPRNSFGFHLGIPTTNQPRRFPHRNDTYGDGLPDAPVLCLGKGTQIALGFKFKLFGIHLVIECGPFTPRPASG